MESQHEFITEIKSKRKKVEGSGVKKGFRNPDSMTENIKGFRCHEILKKKMLDHLEATGQKESEFKREAISYFINLQRGDIS